ncbi:hypothetical protein E4T56_gene17777, partial [Termitomyces sp. T112]
PPLEPPNVDGSPNNGRARAPSRRRSLHSGSHRNDSRRADLEIFEANGRSGRMSRQQAAPVALLRPPHRVVHQRLAERPDRARDLVTAGDHVVERALDPVAVFFGDGERRQQLDGVAAVAGHLREDLVILEQRHGDELAEQALVGGLQHVPRGAQAQRFRRAAFDAAHPTPAAPLPHQLRAPPPARPR